MADLRPQGGPYNLVVKVVESKAIDGRPQRGGKVSKTAECIVGDATASILFVAKDDQVELAQPGAYLSIQDATTEVVRGSMRLITGKQGKVEVASGKDFKAAVGNNLSLIEFELVTVTGGAAQE